MIRHNDGVYFLTTAVYLILYSLCLYRRLWSFISGIQVLALLSLSVYYITRVCVCVCVCVCERELARKEIFEILFNRTDKSKITLRTEGHVFGLVVERKGRMSRGG